MKFKEIKSKVKKWSKEDWYKMNEGDEMVIENRCGGVDYVLSREKYFGELEKVKNFSELESWYMMICGENGGEGFGFWLDEVLEMD